MPSPFKSLNKILVYIKLALILCLPCIGYAQTKGTIKLNNGIKIFVNDIQGNGKDSINVLVRNTWGSIALNEIKYISNLSSKN